MDINYILGREQVSLHNAMVATSLPARIAHQGLATAYGRLLAGSPYPHRTVRVIAHAFSPTEDAGRWEDDGGTSN
jgi:hypothetical protein